MLRTRRKSGNSEKRGSTPLRVRPQPGSLQRFLGWCVHGYTGLGLVAAAVIAVLLVHGGPEAYRWSFMLMALATIVDATDGTLARKVRIKEAVPSFDGRRLDDIIDFLNYTFLPVMLIWRANLLPQGQEGWLIFALVASVYGFCQVHVKTEDGYFLGFPSLWNLVALYLYVLPLDAWTSLAIVIALAVMTFVPSKYLYPSQPGRLNRISTILGAVWTVLVGWLIWILPEASSPRNDLTVQRLALISLAYPIFYMVTSWIITLKHWSAPKPVH